jgi:hypothetical protein
MYFNDYIIAISYHWQQKRFGSQKTSVPVLDPLVRGPDPDPPIIEQK